MENEIKDNIKLPENAFTELKEGEEYQPVMSPDKAYPEVNGWSVTWGVLRSRGGWCHIHPARPLHPQGQVS